MKTLFFCDKMVKPIEKFLRWKMGNNNKYNDQHENDAQNNSVYQFMSMELEDVVEELKSTKRKAVQDRIVELSGYAATVTGLCFAVSGLLGNEQAILPAILSTVAAGAASIVAKGDFHKAKTEVLPQLQEKKENIEAKMAAFKVQHLYQDENVDEAENNFLVDAVNDFIEKANENAVDAENKKSDAEKTNSDTERLVDYENGVWSSVDEDNLTYGTTTHTDAVDKMLRDSMDMDCDMF